MGFLMGFTRAEVFELFELRGLKPPTPKQIHYWTQSELISVDLISAKTAIYSFQTVLNLMIIMQLLEADLSLPMARATFSYLKSEYLWGGHGVRLGQLELMSDGTRTYPLDNTELLIEMLNGKTSWKGFSIDTEKTVKETLALVASKGWLDRLRRDEEHYKRMLVDMPEVVSA